MNLEQAMHQRHSVRSYKQTPMKKDTIEQLLKIIDECNKESGLHIQLITDEPKAFHSRMAHYGKFSDVHNYIALIGKKSKDLEEKCGYYGEKIVLEAQRMGLNTCWVGLTFKKIKEVLRIDDTEKLVMVIAIGYGTETGHAHKSKGMKDVSNVSDDSPEWFIKGAEAALLAPTAMNQQKFMLTQKGNTVHAKAGFGPFSKVDLGIVKYHFEIGAGKENFSWV